jgi:hypothetical protein
MSKKTVSFRNPTKPAVAPEAAKGAGADAETEGAVDRWIHQPDDAAKPLAAAPVTPEATAKAAMVLTVRVSAAPDWFEVIKIWFLLPHLALSFWTLGAWERNLRGARPLD